MNYLLLLTKGYAASQWQAILIVRSGPSPGTAVQDLPIKWDHLRDTGYGRANRRQNQFHLNFSGATNIG
ncbi:MAG: hypothetical protein ACSHWY_08735 [Octadecabacter sp.]